MTEPAVDPVLTALLDALLPGSGAWPSASETRVPPFIARRAGAMPELAQALAAVRALLPADFPSRDHAARTALLCEAEARIPEPFAQIVTEAYRGYYTNARVLALIEHKTGYPARPPQPLGRNVRPTDWSVLAGRAIPTTPLPTLLESHAEISHDR